MRLDPKLMAKIAPKLKNKLWYHQRFDGSPMFIFAISEAETFREKRKPKGTEASVRVCFFSQGKADWYLSMTDIKRGAKKIVELAKKDSKISKKLLKAWRADEKKFENYFWKIFPKINLKKLSDEKLTKTFQYAYALFSKRVTSSSVIDHFALGTDELIGRMLRKEVGQVGKESEFTNIFSIVTAPAHQSFINQAEIDLLKIATKQSKENLEDYQRRYFWSKNNYTSAHILDYKHFKKEISAWKKSGKNLKEQIKHIQNTPKLNKLKKQALLKKLRLSPLLRTLITISEDFTWWQDERKKSTYFNTHIGTEILKEIARRKNYELDELRYAFPAEVKNLVEKSQPTRKELRARRKGCALVGMEKSFDIKHGKWVKKLKKNILGNQSFKNIQDFRGLSASTGRAIGKVKIVKSATEIKKVNKGDILVAVMTRPDYVSGMKKAAAIVTNEGGITSHAAIVSRELGIPCIIGTKIATEVLKDGDLVEVNANHGWVRLVSNSARRVRKIK